MARRRDLKGLRVLVTGASQGIGRAIALMAAKRGSRVLACARKMDLLEELAVEARADGGVLEPVKADVADAEGRRHMAAEAERLFGGLDILINNAGIGATGHFADSDPETLRQIMEVNFFGSTETTRTLLPLLQKGNSAAVVNISSIVGKRALPARGLYSASKFAMEGWSQAIRGEFAKDNIDVIVVNPGLTQTNFSQNMLVQKAKVQMDHMRGMTPEEVAEATLRALEKGTNDVHLTGRARC